MGGIDFLPPLYYNNCMINLKWTDKQKLAVIRMISFEGVSGNDIQRGTALVNIHRITFNDAAELNRRAEEIAKFLPRGIETLKDLSTNE